MKRVWEYYWVTFDFGKSDMDKIDKLGLEGWELIGIFEVRKGFLEFCAVLKRRKWKLK